MNVPIRVGSPEWDALTERRAALIRKKNRDGLTAGESAEYERLQAASRAATEAEFQPGVNLDTPADAGRDGVQYCTGGDN